MYELFGVARGEEKAAVFAILELIQQHLCQLLRELKVAAAPAGLQQFQKGIDEKRVVIEIGRQVSAAILVSREQPAVAPQMMPDEIHGSRRRRAQLRAFEHARGDRQSLDHERIPS